MVTTSMAHNIFNAAIILMMTLIMSKLWYKGCHYLIIKTDLFCMPSECNCSSIGTTNASQLCDAANNGQCPCKENVGGRTCDRCKVGTLPCKVQMGLKRSKNIGQKTQKPSSGYLISLPIDKSIVTISLFKNNNNNNCKILINYKIIPWVRTDIFR